jgi:class 3 adenylate cyclase
VSVGARLLKQIAPGGIIVSGEVVDELRDTAPELAERCRLLQATFEVPGADGIQVATYTLD